MTFGEWLKKTRKEQHMSKVELSRKTGITEVQIYNIENGRVKLPQIKSLYKLTTALGHNYEEVYNQFYGTTR